MSIIYAENMAKPLLENWSFETGDLGGPYHVLGCLTLSFWMVVNNALYLSLGKGFEMTLSLGGAVKNCTRVFK